MPAAQRRSDQRYTDQIRSDISDQSDRSDQIDIQIRSDRYTDQIRSDQINQTDQNIYNRNALRAR